jgi:hypothetical protein
VPVTSVSGAGTLKVNLDQNLSNILDGSSSPLVTAFTTGQAYDVDRVVPTVSSIVRADANPTNAATVNFTVTLSESVTGVAANNFTVVGSGVTGSLGTVTGSGTTWNVPVTSVAGAGTLKVDLDQNLSNIKDAVNNALAVAFTTGQAYTVDRVAPTVSSIVRADANPTNASTVNFTVTLSESVTGVAANNFTVVGSGVTGSVGTVTGSGTIWNVPVTSVSGNGTIKVELDQNLSNIKDAVNNALTAAFTTGESYTVDQAAPISSASVGDPTRAGTTSLGVDFTASDAGGSGVASTKLWVKVPGSPSFADSGLLETGGSGSFTYTASAGDGLYEFATQATDNVGNAEATPAAASATVLLNVVADSVFTQTAVTGSDVLVFPMTDDLDTTLSLSGATPTGTVTVSRSKPRSTPPGYFQGPLSELLDESLSITQSGLGSFTAQLEWAFDNTGAPSIATVWQFNGQTLTQSYAVTPSGNVLTVPGITSFSDWFAGNAVAVPVNLSGFTVE